MNQMIFMAKIARLACAVAALLWCGCGSGVIDGEWDDEGNTNSTSLLGSNCVQGSIFQNSAGQSFLNGQVLVDSFDAKSVSPYIWGVHFNNPCTLASQAFGSCSADADGYYRTSGFYNYISQTAVSQLGARVLRRSAEAYDWKNSKYELTSAVKDSKGNVIRNPDGTVKYPEGTMFPSMPLLDQLTVANNMGAEMSWLTTLETMHTTVPSFGHIFQYPQNVPGSDPATIYENKIRYLLADAQGIAAYSQNKSFLGSLPSFWNRPQSKSAFWPAGSDAKFLFYELGNEPWGGDAGTQGGPFTPDEYFNLAKRFAQTLKQVDPTIKIALVGYPSTGNNMDPTLPVNDVSWTNALKTHLNDSCNNASCFDIITDHPYVGVYPGYWVEGQNTAGELPAYAAQTALREKIQKKITDYSRAQRPVGLSLTEWNFICWQPSQYPWINKVAHGMYVFDSLLEMAEQGVQSAMYHGLARGNCGLFKDRTQFNSMGIGFSLTSVLAGGEMFKTVVADSTGTNSPPVRDVPPLDCFNLGCFTANAGPCCSSNPPSSCFVKDDDHPGCAWNKVPYVSAHSGHSATGDKHLFLMNRHPNQGAYFTIKGFNTVPGQTLRADQVQADNFQDAGFRNCISDSTIVEKNATFIVFLPPKSITRITADAITLEVRSEDALVLPNAQFVLHPRESGDTGPIVLPPTDRTYGVIYHSLWLYDLKLNESRGYDRYIPLKSDGTPDYANASNWLGPWHLSAFNGLPNAGSIVKMLSGSNYIRNNQLAQSFWLKNSQGTSLGYYRVAQMQSNGYPDWNRIVSLYGPMSLADTTLPGHVGTDYQSEAHFMMANGMLSQNLWRDNQGFVRTVPMNSAGTEDWGRAFDPWNPSNQTPGRWFGPCPIEKLPGEGEMQASTNLMLPSGRLFQSIWRSNKNYSRTVPMASDGTPNFNAAGAWHGPNSL